VRPDLRGFGASPLPAGPFSFVEDARALLDELGIERAAVVGNSFGGRVAIDLALAHPERISALLLVAPALTGFEGSAALDAFDEAEDALLDAGRVDEAVELNLRTWLDGQGRASAPVARATREHVATMQRRAFEIQLAAYAKSPPPGPAAWSDPPAASRLATVAVPTLVVTGTYDRPEFRSLGERVAAGIPGAKSSVMDTAHLPGIERPEELSRLVLTFLDTTGG
jgi:pimeloyl-ACP methyl ester carboxylesterase